MKRIPLIIIVLISVIFTGCDRQIPEPTSKIHLVEDENYICYLNETIEINFLENDEISGEVTVIVDEPSNGKIKLNTDGISYKYSPNPGFIGTDAFNYEVCNSDECKISKIKIQVAPTLNACDEIFKAQRDIISIEPNLKYSFTINSLL